MPYAGPPPTGPELVVSFKHPGRLSERCRVPTPEENARVPVHMRRDRICERGRSPVRMRVTVDGAEVLARSYAPRGLHRDEASVVLERIAVPAGDHAVRLEIGDSADANEWSWRDERTLRFAPGRRVVALFDRSRLFDWGSPRATAPR